MFFLFGLVSHLAEAGLIEALCFVISMSLLAIAVVCAMASLALQFREERRLAQGEDE